MKRVILESPYKGDIETNVAYARRALRHSLSLGESPIASHLLYTQPGVLDDNIEEERNWGIEAGLAWGTVADATVLYLDLGVSNGMKKGIEFAQLNRPIIGRWLDYSHDEGIEKVLTFLHSLHMFTELRSYAPNSDPHA